VVSLILAIALSLIALYYLFGVLPKYAISRRCLSA
jgi:hypothetical protein